MTQKTISENLFERFCSQLGIECVGIPRGEGKTPDFEIVLGGKVVLTELKQLDPNANDLAIIDQGRHLGTVASFCASDSRVRRKINEAGPQLKARSHGLLPTMVVLYDNGTFDGIDYIDIKTAMFGDEKVVVAFMNHQTQHVTPIHSGGGRRMTESCNTSVSAVALLHGPTDRPALSIFHNHFAQIPIVPDWFRHERVLHYSLASDRYEWTRVRKGIRNSQV